MADATLRKLVLQKAALQREFGAEFGRTGRDEVFAQKLERLSQKLDALDARQDAQDTRLDNFERRLEALEGG